MNEREEYIYGSDWNPEPVRDWNPIHWIIGACQSDEEGEQNESKCGEYLSDLRQPENANKRAVMGTCITATTCSTVATSIMCYVGSTSTMVCAYGFSAFITGGCFGGILCCLICKANPCGCNKRQTGNDEFTPLGMNRGY